jgi:hypothetical protein
VLFQPNHQGSGTSDLKNMHLARWMTPQHLCPSSSSSWPAAAALQCYSCPRMAENNLILLTTKNWNKNWGHKNMADQPGMIPIAASGVGAACEADHRRSTIRIRSDRQHWKPQTGDRSAPIGCTSGLIIPTTSGFPRRSFQGEN